MARSPRIDLAGYHHVVNRGVEKRKIYIDREDYETFLELLCSVSFQFDVTLHSYCLMSNHYHLLIETHQENLSKAMRAVNAGYAAYFNRKYKRVGHLWQGRFKSWFVTDEAYLYTLIKYIEFNPVKAKIVKNLDDYAYSSYAAFSETTEPIACLHDSIMFTQFSMLKDRVGFFENWYDEDVLKEIRKSSRLVVSSVKTQKLSLKPLRTLFKDYVDKNERNRKIVKAVELGYSQHMIANVLGMTQGSVSHVMKKHKRTE
ncbi:MAG: transposase [Campylobacterota bacterium]|nr:transposase [Campylobacterota bacterium]